MQASAERKKGRPLMRSRVGWAVLGLLVERPSYGNEVARRVQAAYGEDLTVSSISQIYGALNVLQAKALIEEVPTPAGAKEAAGPPKRQPKPHYSATAEGRRRYKEWLLGDTDGGSRPRLLAPYLLRLEAHQAIEVIDHIEQACREELRSIESGEIDDSSRGEEAKLGADLAREADRLSIEARLSFIKSARGKLERGRG
jgi:DNA-binding PadR family transcriptional regulator